MLLSSGLLLKGVKYIDQTEDFKNNTELLFLEDAEDVPLAKVLRNNSVLEKEEVVPLWSAVVFGLGSPKEPGNETRILLGRCIFDRFEIVKMLVQFS